MNNDIKLVFCARRDAKKTKNLPFATWRENISRKDAETQRKPKTCPWRLGVKISLAKAQRRKEI
jgi:hypothetical protein